MRFPKMVWPRILLFAFLLSLAGFGAAADLSFSLHEYDLGGEVNGMFLTDFDGDGRPDLLTKYVHTNLISVLRGKPDGTFAKPKFIPVPIEPVEVAVPRRFDSRLPQIVVSDAGLRVASFKSGTWTTPSLFDPLVRLRQPVILAPEDFSFPGVSLRLEGQKRTLICDFSEGGWDTRHIVEDNDREAYYRSIQRRKRPEELIVRYDERDKKFLVLTNAPGGTQKVASSFPGSPFWTKADFDGDRKDDIAFSDEFGGTVTVLLGDGQGGFHKTLTLQVPARPWECVSGDFNGDGRPDLAVCGSMWGTLSVFLNGAREISTTVSPENILKNSGRSPDPDPVEILNSPAGLAGRSWGIESGLPAGDAKRIFADANGYMWFAFTGGLARFDGVRMKRFDRNVRTELPSDDCTDVAQAEDGCIWVATHRAGLWELREGSWRIWGEESGLRPTEITSIGPGASNRLWVADGQLHLIENGEIRHWKIAADAVFEDRSGRILLSDRTAGLGEFYPATGRLRQIGRPTWRVEKMVEDGSGKVFFYNGGSVRELDASRTGEKLTLGAEMFQGTLRDFCLLPDGALLLASSKGLFTFASNVLTRIEIPGDLLDNRLSAVAYDGTGSIWVASARGIKRLRRPLFKTMSPQDPLQQIISSIEQDADGSMWTGTAGGLLHWKSNGVVRYGQEQGLLGNVIRCVRRDDEDRLWLGYGDSGLSVFQNGRIRSCKYKWQWNPGVNGIFVASNKDVVLTGHTRGHLISLQGTKLSFLPDSPVPPERSPENFETLGYLETRTGERWIGSYGAGLLLHYTNRTGYEVLRRANGVPTDIIAPMYEDSSGAVWFGTDKGIVRRKNGRFSWIRVEDGLLEGIPFNLIEDDFGNIWSNGRNGIYRYPKKQLDDFCDGAQPRVEGEAYGAADGMLTVESDGPAFPGACKRSDGVLWFPTVRGVVVIDPRRAQPPGEAVAPVIEQIVLDDRVVYGDDAWRSTNSLKADFLRREARFGPGAARVLRIQYTAPGSFQPEDVIFERRLEGLDPDWAKAGENGAERAAYYTNLKPGHYKFRVRAKHPGSPWRESPATFGFYLEPHFYETTPFFALCFCGLFVSAYGIHSRRLRTQAQWQSFEQKALLERERARIARDMHDSIGANLARIQLLSQTAASAEAGAKEKLAKITDTARSTARDMDEIIWLLKSSQHTLRDLTDYLTSYAREFLADAGISLSEEVPPDLPEMPVPVDTCHNLFLAFKEALANITRHSRASAVSLACKREGNSFTLEVFDNGRGFSPSSAPSRPNGTSHGLGNMRERMSSIGGGFAIISKPGEGTRALFSIAC